jgi:RHS repeat-associated protein
MGVLKNYLNDALGSVVGTLSDVGALDNTYHYTPYGGPLGADPGPTRLFAWNGCSGYLSERRNRSSHYVRARHYSNTEARWTTSDLLWPVESAYNYSFQNPINNTDPSGHGAPGYGRYCGPRNGPGTPKDDLDWCCYHHDVCLATARDWLNPVRFAICQAELCFCATLANCGASLLCWSWKTMITSWSCKSMIAPLVVSEGPLPGRAKEIVAL